jgi:hypothetical protein
MSAKIYRDSPSGERDERFCPAGNGAVIFAISAALVVAESSEVGRKRINSLTISASVRPPDLPKK